MGSWAVSKFSGTGDFIGLKDYSVFGCLRMFYRVYDQLVILVGFRHLNGNLKLAESGDGINLWGCAMERTTLADLGWWVMGLMYGDASWGRATGSGWWNWFVGGVSWGAWHWLDLGDGIDLWGRAMGARDWIGRWKWFVGAHHGGARHWLDLGEGIDL